MSYKVERLQQVIRFKVTQTLQRELADPRMGLITVTRIKLARDLSHCVVFYSVLGDDSAKSRCAHALDDARGFIQREVAGALKTRVTPHLEFKFDASIEGSARVSELLRSELGDEVDEEPSEDLEVEDDSPTDPDRD